VLTTGDTRFGYRPSIFFRRWTSQWAKAMERTIRYKEGNYASTFLETSKDTNGAYELIRVEIQPKGGNSFHYHRTFEEKFTAQSHRSDRRSRPRAEAR
jgi:hypothetical protein